jgi:para-nitrobenzyl esterase
MKNQIFPHVSAIVLVFLMILAVSCDKESENSESIVDTSEGPVKGRIEVVNTNKGEAINIYSYKGIPYAAPPVGDLRWKAPQPPLVRDDILDAKTFCADCQQLQMAKEAMHLSDGAGQSEDCLFLNIWRPLKEGIYPVMFWIHGGGLLLGSPAAKFYHGDRLSAKEDVVVVSINYRLGPFGFLSLEALEAEDNDGSSGNYGLLDCIAALKWVKKNIGNFGGNPDNITIFGQSAGGWIIFNLLSSPKAEGLFHKAIVQSGASDASLSTEEAFEAGERFAKIFGCKGDDIVSCMRTKSANTLIAGNISSMSLDILYGRKPLQFISREDGEVVPEKTIDRFKAGAFNNVPILAGTNKYEQRIITGLFPTQILPKFISDIPYGILSWIYGFDEDEIKERYAKADYFSETDALLAAIMDAALVCPTYRGIREIASHQEKTWYYRFDFNDHVLGNSIGTGHALEVPFVFGTLDRLLTAFGLLDIYTRSQAQAAIPLEDAMMSYWANFARTGNPNGQGLPNWPAFRPGGYEQKMFLDLPQPHAGENDVCERCEYWEDKGIY